MKFFRKIWKGIKGVFKRIGRGVKKTFKKFGKFMDKIGILGQVAMMFILPAVGGALMANIGNLASWGVRTGGVIGKIAEGAAWTLGKAKQFSELARGAYNSITEPITGFFKTTGKYVGSKLQKIMPNIKLPAGWNVPENYTLKQAKADWWEESVAKNWNVFKDESGHFFSKSIESVLPETGAVTLGPSDKLVTDPLEGLTERQEARYGDKLVDPDTLRVETTFPSGRVESTYAKDLGAENLAGKEYMEEAFKSGITDPKTGIRTYDPTVAPPKTWQQNVFDQAIKFPGDVISTTTGQIKSDVGKSILAGEKTGTLAYFDDPPEPYKYHPRGSFESDPAALAGDQDLTAFISLADMDYRPPDQSAIWAGRNNYQTYLSRFAPAPPQQQYG
jgi:hypothetical protein